MENTHIVDRVLLRKLDGQDVSTIAAEAQTARSIVDLLCETGMTIEMAAWVLDVCKESLRFIPLSSQKTL